MKAESVDFIKVGHKVDAFKLPHKTRAALFLDRDGIINEDIGYAYRKEDIRFVDGIFDLVAAANRLGLLVLVITNQAGIGRGYYTESDFHELMLWMNKQFQNSGLHLDGVYFCPHHPVHGKGKYKIVCRCRKPAPGMLIQAQMEYGIDMQHSVMVGDSFCDMQAARVAGVGLLAQMVSQKCQNQDSTPIYSTIHRVTSVAHVIPLLRR